MQQDEDYDDQEEQDRLLREEIQKKLEYQENERQAAFPDRGIIYLGHIPYGFFEEQMYSFFQQFGNITRYRLARNLKTGKSRHHAFIEFEEKEVATIVAEAMNNFLLFGRRLICNEVHIADVHDGIFRVDKTPPELKEKSARKAHNRDRTRKEQRKRRKKLLTKERARGTMLENLGISYDFEGYKGKIKPKSKRIGLIDKETNEDIAPPGSENHRVMQFRNGREVFMSLNP